MAEIILTNVLNKKIAIDELVKWLTADNPEETISPEIEQNGCTRTDFVSHFLNYLREQCKSILPEVKEAQENPVKKVPGKIALPNKKPPKTEAPVRTPSYINKKNYSDYKTRQALQANYQPRSAVHTPQGSPLLHGVSVVCLGPRLPGAPNLRALGSPAHFPPLPHERNAPESPLFHDAPHRFQSPNFQAYYPANMQFQPSQLQGNWNHGDIARYQTQLMSPKPYFDNSMDANRPTGTSSPYNNSNPSVAALNETQMQMASLNVSSTSGYFDTSFYNVSSNASSPVRYDNSMRNHSSGIVNTSMANYSPVSPLYANNMPVYCPPSGKSDKYHNATHSSHDYSSNSANGSRTSTPRSSVAPDSAQKLSKSSQNPNFRLGDFIINDGMSSNKSSKKQSKANSSKQSQMRKTPSDAKPEKENNSSKTQSNVSETKSARRIKPTRLNVTSDNESRETEVFGVISRPTAANPKFIEAPSTDKSQEELSFEVERGLLKLERQRQPKNEEPRSNIESKLPPKTKLESAIVPCPDLVENAETLDILANLYCAILHRNLMTNPMTEMYFVMTLLTTQYRAVNEKNITPKKEVSDTSNPSSSSPSSQELEKLKDDLGCSELPEDITTEVTVHGGATSCDEKMIKRSLSENKDESSKVESSQDDRKETKNEDKKDSLEYLNTPHNCVYFATVVILNQQYLLSVLDRATLKLLCENQQIASFQPELQKYLNDVYTDKCSRMNRVKQMGNSQTNVCFQADTDNREMFPSSSSFAVFRKQRDLFYSILKDWEDCHLKPGWSYQNALKNKINTLLALHTDPVNYCHLAKLFISQLLVSSVQNGKAEDPMNDESLSFLKDLKDVNPEKLLQLKGRLVTPLTSTGPVPQPTFPGVQEFYKEFILSACNWKFYVILENTLVAEILELNEAQFAHSEIESTETTVDESTKQDFIICVSSLRLLAKFTSFALSLPFKSAKHSPEWQLSQIQLRKRVMPSLDLQSCLLDAWANGRLSLTVPWIVQYMGMLDAVTLRLPYFINIGELLYCIYRLSINCDSVINNDLGISHQISTLMAFTIGWLFELTNFPRDLYTHWQINYNTKRPLIPELLKCSRDGYRNLITMGKEADKDFVKRSSALDQLDIIDDRAFYECCPFLTEFKILLISGNATLSNSNANRHITPVSSQLSQPTFGTKTKNLEMQLEEAFFHGQPDSIRKSVDFIAERVASNCVKYICSTIIPALKEQRIKEYIKSKNGKIDLITTDEDAEDRTESSPGVSPTETQRKAQVESADRAMQALAVKIVEDVKRESLQKIPEICETRTARSMESILADDVFSIVKETCIAIANRTAIERVKQWIESHVVESFCLKNMNNDMKRLLKETIDDQPSKETSHNEDAPAPTEVIEMIRNSMWELLEKQHRWCELSTDYVSKTLKYLQQTLTERGDLVEYPEKKFYTMSVEYCLLLITHRQDLFTAEIQKEFLNVWKMNNSRTRECEDLFARIISPRNIRLLTSTSGSSSMKLFARLLKALLKENLLNIESLSDQCVALFRQDWPESILKELSPCLRDAVSDYKCSGAQAEAMKYLLDWIATTCDQMEIYD